LACAISVHAKCNSHVTGGKHVSRTPWCGSTRTGKWRSFRSMPAQRLRARFLQPPGPT